MKNLPPKQIPDKAKPGLYERNGYRIVEYIRSHPGCTNTQIQIALGMLAHDFVMGRKIVGNRIITRKEGSKEAHYYLAESEQAKK
jgi:hypothetical protein